MKLKFSLGLALAIATLVSCDNTTDDIGITVIDNADKLAISTDTFSVSTQSLLADSILSRSTTAYLGKVRDPETGAYVTGDCMIQFHSLENIAFPKKDSIISKIDGKIVADSVEIKLFTTDYYGDTLAPMKMRVYEMGTPMSEGVNYYSNYDPYKQGLIREDGLKIDKAYTIVNMNDAESARNNSSYYDNIRILLDKSYTDKDGNQYNNYGSYIMNKYYDDNSNFKNSYTFIHNVVPGFYFKNTGGLGSMAYVTKSQLNVYFRYTYNDSIYTGVVSFAGTEEVLQTTTISNDNNTINKMVADNSCTYLKTPAGIFTEITLPVDEIKKGHENDFINSAKLSLTRINNSVESQYALGVPQNLLIIPKADLYTFFEEAKLPDYKSSFIASYSSSSNGYTFGNISGLINYMDENRNSDDWNKAVIIPVSVSYYTNSSTNVSYVTGVVHDMSLSSTKLVKGTNGSDSPIKISVIYSKFK